MQKILIDANPIVPYLITNRHTGIGRTCLELIKSLDSIRDSIPFKIDLYTQNLKGISAKKINTGFKSHHVFLRNIPSHNHLAAQLGLREILSRYDLMHITHNYAIIRNPSKCIVTAHDAFYMHFDDPKFNYSEIRDKYSNFLKACKHIITCSEYSKNDISASMNISPDKITVIPWGIDHSNFYVINKEEACSYVKKKFNITKPFFISVSCDLGRKRTPALIDSYLSLENPKHDLVLVWGNCPDSIKKKVDGNSRVHILGKVTDQDLRFLYNAASASFNPSKYEGFGLPVLEAMACACVPITCYNSSIPEVGGDVAIYLEEPVEKSLFNIMKLIESDSIDFSRSIMGGPIQAQKFTWLKTAQSTLYIYEKVLQCVYEG